MLMQNCKIITCSPHINCETVFALGLQFSACKHAVIGAKIRTVGCQWSLDLQVEMRHLLLTSCTRRKRVRVEPALSAAALSRGPINSVAADWADRIQSALALVPATKLYAGRGFVEARAAGFSPRAPLFIISAGLGLIEGQTRVPAYSLTLARKDPTRSLVRFPAIFRPLRGGALCTVLSEEVMVP